MHIFLILVSVALGEKISKNSNIVKQKSFLIGLLVSGIFIIGSYFYSKASYGIIEILLGVGEKQHGILLPIGITLLIFLLFHESKKSRENILKISIGAALFIAIVAIIETFLHYNIFTGEEFKNTGSWGVLRSTSTLGNPNYVAGYLLMHLPLIYYIVHRGEKYVGLILLILGIAMTGSIIGMTLAVFFLMALLLKKIVPKFWPYLLFLIVIIGCFGLSVYLSGNDKWLSLVSRFILMRESFLGNINSFLHILFGQGPMGIIDYYETYRSVDIDNYFPSSMIIDSSHNIFIDFFFQYGLIGVLFLVYPLFTFWKKCDLASKWGVALSLIFLSLNVFVLSHLIVLALLLARRNT